MQIIVPVYNAFESLQNCVESLERHSCNVDAVFINDASTDDRVLPYLESVCINNNKWSMLSNDENLGFVKTANKGLRLTKEHTVLLNSDTLVTTGWLDGLIYAANNCVNIGTATPWSNNAEICSFPKTLVHNKVPENLDCFAAVLQQTHQATFPEIPTAVGFCMLVSKQAKAVVGYFDEQTFGHGYGEENDYSLRVKQSGLKNVLCDNVYVAHVGNQSFQDMKLKPNNETMERLLSKHPGYSDLISDFIQEDALATLRESIIDKISQLKKPGYLAE